MKKLYIPTSTCNFNNILSSESISPKAFYALRKFGYYRWTNIPENDNDNVILLYEEPFAFSRPKSDTEDHPMLVEIETDEEFPQTRVKGVRYSDHTIYLVRRCTHFVFFNEQDMRTTLSLSESSAETKLVDLYKRQIYILDYQRRTQQQDIKVETGLNEVAIEKDIRINKMKGLLYGYYIGAYLSTPKEITERHKRLTELRNIFGAVVSSEGRQPTDVQQKRMDEIFFDIKKENPAFNVLTKYCPDNMNEILDFEFQLIQSGWSYTNYFDADEIIRELSTEEEAKTAFLWLRNEEKKLAKDEQNKRKPLSVNANELIVKDDALSYISTALLQNEDEKKLVKEWVNDIFILPEYNKNIASFKSDLATEITRKARKIFGDAKWENSDIKRWLNNMRRYIKGEDVEIEWDNPLVASITSVLLKGDDIDNLLAFMRSKSISDYRIAFAFYGMLHGFANLTRDFTDNLYTYKDNNYISEVYIAIYEQTQGKPFPQSSLPEKNYRSPYSISEKLITDSEKAISDAQWKYDFEKIINDRRRKLDDRTQREAQSVINASSNPQECYYKLANGVLKNKKTVLQALREKFHLQDTTKQHQKALQGNLFPSDTSPETHKFFYNDPKAWEHIQKLIPQENSLIEKIHVDVEWFQNEYRKGEAGSYKDSPRDNESTIKHFKNYLLGKSYKQRLNIDEIIKRLRQKYDK
ncbi:MAG: hypothetical protein SPK45_07395 [Anaerovoracaceae bacterium]|nr:hypothetical protein [Anaerovoracaceae bacterium]